MLSHRFKDYTSLENMQLECEKLFKPFYHYGAHRCELKEIGSYLTLESCGKSIVIWNDDGVIRAFENSCSHRGCKLLKDKEGCQSKIVCPYHGWQFRKGQTIPSSKEFLVLSQEELSLTYYQVDFCGEFVFFSPEPMNTLRNQLGFFYDELVEISITIKERYDWNSFNFKSNWKISVENAVESYHVKDIHFSTLYALNLDTSNVLTSNYNDQLLAPIKNLKIDKKLNLLRSFFGSVVDKKLYFSYYLFPFSMISSTYGYSYAIQNFFPNSNVCESNFLSRVYGVETNMTFFYNDVVELNKKIFSEDSDVCELVQNASQSHKNKFHYGIGETRILFFHEGYSELMK